MTSLPVFLNSPKLQKSGHGSVYLVALVVESASNQDRRVVSNNWKCACCTRVVFSLTSFVFIIFELPALQKKKKKVTWFLSRDQAWLCCEAPHMVPLRRKTVIVSQNSERKHRMLAWKCQLYGPFVDCSKYAGLCWAVTAPPLYVLTRSHMDPVSGPCACCLMKFEAWKSCRNLLFCPRVVGQWEVCLCSR